MTDLAKITIEAKDNTQTDVQSAINNIQGVGSAIDNLKGKMAALGGIFSIGVIVAEVTNLAKYRAELERIAVVTGTTVENLSVIGQAAKLAGVDMGTVEAAMVKLTKGLSASNADTKDTARALEYLGLKGRDAAGNLRDPGVVMQEIAKALGPLADGSNKTAIALALFGKSGAQMLPILKEMFENGGLVAKVTAEQALQAKAYEQALVRLGAAQSAAGKMIYGEMIVPLTALIEVYTRTINGTDSLNASVKALSQSGELTGWAENTGGAIATAMEATLVLGGNVVFVIKAIGTEIGGIASQLVALAHLDFKGFVAIGDQIKADAATAREGFDVWEKSILTSRDAYQALIDKQKESAALVRKYAGGEYKDARDLRVAAGVPAFRGTDHEGPDKLNPYQAEFAALEKEKAALMGIGEVEAYLTKLAEKRFDVLTPKQREILINDEKQIVALKQQKLVREEMIKSDEAFLLVIQKIMDVTNDYQIALRETGNQIEFQNSLIGKSAAEIAKANEMRRLDLDLRTQIKALGEVADADEVLRLIQLNDEAKKRIGLLMDTGVTLQSLFDNMKKMADIMGSIGDAIGSVAVAFSTGWKKGTDSAKKELASLRDALIAMVAKQWFLSVVAGGAAVGSPLANAATGALGASQNSLLGTGLNAAGTYLGGALFGSSAAYAGAIGGGSALAGSQAALLAAQTGEFGLAGLSATAAAAGTGGIAGATAGIGSSITAGLAAIPVWGWIAVAALAAYAAFGGKGGGAKVGGSYGAAFDATGAMTGSNTNSLFGLSAAESTGNGATKSLATATAKEYFDLVGKLGGKSQGISFGIGYDSDPRGTADNRITAILKDALGKTLFSESGRAIGRDSAQIGPELQLSANRALLAALQASKLPDDIANIINSVVASGATQTQIDDVLQRATAMQQLFGAIGVSLDTVTTPIKTVIELIHDQGAALAEFARTSDRSAASLATLTTSTAQYRAQVTALIQQYEDAKGAIGKTIDDTIRGFVFSTLDKNGQYGMLQSEAAGLRAGLGGMTDAAAITSTIQQIAQLSNQAFGLLDPAAQKAQLDDFIAGLKDAQTVADTRLADLQQAAADAANEALANTRKNIAQETANAATNLVSAQLNYQTAQLNAATAAQGIQVNVGSPAAVQSGP